jgi:hypothetical protein
MLADQGNWWQHLSDAYQADTIISSDKRPRHFEGFGLPDWSIILWRKPRAWVASWRRRRPDVPLEKAIDIWNTVYGNLIAWCQDNTKHVGLCWDDVRANPETVLDRLCMELDLPMVSQWGAIPNFSIKHHHIGGCAELLPEFVRGSDEAWRTELTEEAADQVLTQTAKVHRMLQRRGTCESD